MTKDLSVDVLPLPDGTIRLFGMVDGEIKATRDMNLKSNTFHLGEHEEGTFAEYILDGWFLFIDLTDVGTIAITSYLDAETRDLDEYFEFTHEGTWLE